MNTHN